MNVLDTLKDRPINVQFLNAIIRDVIEYVESRSGSSSFSIDDWESGVRYQKSVFTIKDKSLYRCLKTHTSGTFNVDYSHDAWERIGDTPADNPIDNPGGISVWEPNMKYSLHNVVIYNNKLYLCITPHISSKNFAVNCFQVINDSSISQNNQQNSENCLLYSLIL